MHRISRAIAATLVLLPALAGAQVRPSLRPQTCSAADSVLGPPKRESPEALGGWYNPSTDTTFLIGFLGHIRPAEAVHVKLRFKGPGPYFPIGLPLGLTFTGGVAKRIAADSVKHSVSAQLEPDSIALDLGPPVITALNKTGSSPAITVNAIVTKASLMSLVKSRRATISWHTFKVVLDSRALGVLRGVYRAALCAPAGISTRLARE